MLDNFKVFDDKRAAMHTFEQEPERLPALLLKRAGKAFMPGTTMLFCGTDQWPDAAYQEAIEGRLKVVVLSGNDRGIEAQVSDFLRLPNGEMAAKLRGLRRMRVLGTSKIEDRLSALVVPEQRLRAVPGSHL